MVAGRIRLGLEKDAAPKVIAEYVASFWNEHLARHFEHEERYLLPLREQLEDDELLDRMVVEHRDIRAQVEVVHGGGADDLSKLARMMKAHIRFEERQLFPLLEKHIPEAALREAGTRLRDAHKDADLSWDPTFWE